jgi:hypothetical protein
LLVLLLVLLQRCCAVAVAVADADADADAFPAAACCIWLATAWPCERLHNLAHYEVATITS